MKLKRTNILLPFIVSLVMACGGGSGSTETKSEETPAEDKTTSAVSDTAYLVIEGNDLMQYNLDKLEVTEGQIVKLTLKHTGTMSAEVMGHNWVLLAPGTDKTAFGMAAVDARDNQYIPQDRLESVLANTDIIGGGEETSVIFDAPKMGYYDYLCSFPGHWGVMQGTLTVSPR